MSVGFAYELPNSPQVSMELGRITATRYLQVVSNSFDDGPMTAISAIGVPQAYQPYAFHNDGTWDTLRCRSVKADRKEPNSLVWIITAEYSTPELKELGGTDTGGGGGIEPDGALENPLIELPEIEFTTESHRIPITNVFDPTVLPDPDIDEYNDYLNRPMIHPLMATNGEIYTEPPEKDDTRLIMTIERNEPLSFNHPYLSVVFKDSVNSDAWGWGIGIGQSKMKGIAAKRMTRQLPSGATIAYLRVRYEMQLAPNFNIQIADSGSWFYKREVLDDGTGHPVTFITKEHFTDGKGVPLERGFLNGVDGGILDDGTAPKYFNIQPYRALPFSLLNLPTNWLSVM